MLIHQLYNLYLESAGITTDSRKIEAGTIFFALKGENFDGNRFALQALDEGASYAIIDDDTIAKNSRLIVVNDVLTTLQELANFHRKQFEIPILAITGSNGKTTTKELLAAVLGTQYKTHFTQGNFNNHIGVPLTLLSIGAGTEIAVIEMGANHQGEIRALCEIAEPTHGLITNIGKAHLEGFGGIEGVKKGKSELYDHLAKHKGVAFINLDEEHLKSLSEHVEHRIFYMQSDTPNKKKALFETALVSNEPVLETAFLSDNREALINAKSNLYGQYNFNNLQSAIAIGRYFKVPDQKIKKGIEEYIPSNNRSQILEYQSNIFLMDAYNANPTSMTFAIDNLVTFEANQKMAIVGDMLELGEHSLSEHRAIIDYAISKSFLQLVLVGSEFGAVLNEEDKALHFNSVIELKEWYDKQTFENYVILLKGSRGIKLEQLLS